MAYIAFPQELSENIHKQFGIFKCHTEQAKEAKPYKCKVKAKYFNIINAFNLNEANTMPTYS